MPRQPRKIEVGEIYHVINRGVEKRKIFLKNQDYSRFILALEFFNTMDHTNLWPMVSKAGSVPAPVRISKRRQGKRDSLVDLLAFTLMPNHFHLILREIKKGGISLFMKKMGGYSWYFNKQYERVGPLFQSRYKTVPITSDEQLQIVFAYTHTNPVELFEPGWKEFKVKDPQRALQKLKEYRWSSYRDYIGLKTFPSVTNRSFFLKFFGKERNCLTVVKQWIEYKARNISIDEKTVE